jgi:nicotinamidase-related amidase
MGRADMLGLVIIDMQRWMFRYPERAEQVPLLVGNINALANVFVDRGLPIFDVRTIHKADRSTWSRLMHKHDYPCLLEGTDDVQVVDGYRSPELAVQITKTANSVFLATDFETALKTAGVAELVLTGVFADGCVGLTAADAAQRRLDVTFVDDAIGHSRPDRREAILDWLTDSYELKRQTTEQMLARVRS